MSRTVTQNCVITNLGWPRWYYEAIAALASKLITEVAVAASGWSLTVGQGIEIPFCGSTGCLALHHLPRCSMIQSVKARSNPISRAKCLGSTRLSSEVPAEAAGDSPGRAAFGGKPLVEWGSFVSSIITASKTDSDDSGFALRAHTRERAN